MEREKATEVQNHWKGTLGFVSDHPSATKVRLKSAFLELEKESRNVTQLMGAEPKMSYCLWPALLQTVFFTSTK